MITNNRCQPNRQQTQGLCSEIYFGSADAEISSRWYEAFAARRGELEAAFGGELEWEPLPGRKGCRIAVYREGRIEEVTNWDEYIDWFIDVQSRLRGAISQLGGLAAIIA